MEIFKDFLNLITPFLKEEGYSKKGNNFYIKGDKNRGIINFQKSRESTNDLVKFTINFGIYSETLAQLEFVYNRSNPSVEDCQWGARVGLFMPERNDYWWYIKLSDELTNIVLEIMNTIRSFILPEINKRLSDEDLINNWMNGGFTGTTEIGKFKYLTTLLKAKGELETLKQVVQNFMQQSQGKPIEKLAKEHLEEIDYCN